ncbi:FAD/NAD(P)-binding domain-containing protein [Xylariaceae sp. FL1272]|nr:FAD/NAD(P)-binding domain-containing protein [Xylariaceae sp. FL1272]
MGSFRAIILGAGPVGLYTANALAAAGIDFLVLERQPEVVSYRGALIVLACIRSWPPLIRLLDQLGMYGAITKVGTRMSGKTDFTYQDEPLNHLTIFESLEEKLGYVTIACSRNNLVRVLYENLPGRETRVRTNAEAKDIENLEDGVRVHLADGTTVEGSVVIAADGVHSSARQFIQRSTAPTGSKPETPMVASFMSIFGRSLIGDKEVDVGWFAESHGPSVASQSARCRDALYYTVLAPLPKPTTDRKRFTTEELEQLAASLSETTVFPGVKLKELWASRDKQNIMLLHQEEGGADMWYHGRTVIVGDAAHKMTSINGQGALQGILSATNLVNSLFAALRKNSFPNTDELEAAFNKYQNARQRYVQAVCKFGHERSRIITWSSPEIKAADLKESRLRSVEVDVNTRLMPQLVGCDILDFVPFKSKNGTVPWIKDGKSPIRASL